MRVYRILCRSYRALYILNWIYRFLTEPNYRQYLGEGSGWQGGPGCVTLEALDVGLLGGRPVVGHDQWLVEADKCKMPHTLHDRTAIPGVLLLVNCHDRAVLNLTLLCRSLGVGHRADGCLH